MTENITYLMKHILAGYSTSKITVCNRKDIRSAKDAHTVCKIVPEIYMEITAPQTFHEELNSSQQST